MLNEWERVTITWVKGMQNERESVTIELILPDRDSSIGYAIEWILHDRDSSIGLLYASVFLVFDVSLTLPKLTPELLYLRE